MFARSALALVAAGGLSWNACAQGDPRFLTYSEPGGVALKVHVFEAPGSTRRPAVVLFHGGGWTEGEPAWVFAAARRFAERGFPAFAVQYRLSGAEVTPVEALQDACASLQWVRATAAKWNVDPRRVIAYGVSAGGHLAGTAATIGCGNKEGSLGNGGPDALVLWSPALDVARSTWFAKLLAGRASPESLSPVENVRGPLPPTSIVHGEEDTVTRIRGSRAFCEAAKAHGGRCEVIAYPGVGHLLTRNLKHQESDFDVDPATRADGIRRQMEFVEGLWPR
ncbi:hypothetical protein BWI17_05605 [Betaproteobacteria bacterium GR16-43]|nr:hypothetical protein BWI17_05605 [Betaproteobacteria bacterium GR16-43]